MSNVTKIMERESALKILEDMKNKICDVDLDALCGEETNVKAANETLFNRLVQAVMCGLVFYDEEKSCLVQKLIKPVKSGEMSREALYYRHQLTLGQMKQFKSTNEIGYGIESLATITACPIHLIEQLAGQDQQIATACIDFFGK